MESEPPTSSVAAGNLTEDAIDDDVWSKPEREEAEGQERISELFPMFFQRPHVNPQEDWCAPQEYTFPDSSEMQ